MGRYYYEDGRWPWRPDGILRKFLGRGSPGTSRFLAPNAGQGWLSGARARNDKLRERVIENQQILRFAQNDRRSCARRALDVGMGYGRNAVWLAERGYEVEGWELDRRYLAEAKRELRRREAGRQGSKEDQENSGELGRRLTCRRVDFTRARFRGPYDVVVISLALHQVPRSAGLRVLRGAKAALAPGGMLFLLVKLTRDRHFQRVQATPGWKRVAGERNTFLRPPVPGRRYFHAGRRRLRHRILSALTPGEVKGALRGLRIRHWREQVLRSDWEEPEPACPACPERSRGELVERVTHHVAEIVAEKTKTENRK